MATEKQLAANRANSAKSTGPITTAGKAASAQNARKHGILSKHAISDFEDQERFDELFEQLVRDFSPEGALECILVERMAIQMWREQRLAQVEAELITEQGELAKEFLSFRMAGPTMLPLKDQQLIGRYQGMLGRQSRDTLRDLRDEQDRRLRLVQEAKLLDG